MRLAPTLLALSMMVPAVAHAKHLDIRFTTQPDGVVVAQWRGCVVVFVETQVPKTEVRTVIEKDLAVASECAFLPVGQSLAYEFSRAGYSVQIKDLGILSNKPYMDQLLGRAQALAAALKRDFNFCLTSYTGQPYRCRVGLYDPEPTFAKNGPLEILKWRGCEILYQSDVSRIQAQMLLEYELKELAICKGSQHASFTMFDEANELGYRYRLASPDDVNNPDFLDKMTKRAERLSTFFGTVFRIEFAEPIGGNIIGHVSSQSEDQLTQETIRL